MICRPKLIKLYEEIFESYKNVLKNIVFKKYFESGTPGFACGLVFCSKYLILSCSDTDNLLKLHKRMHY